MKPDVKALFDIMYQDIIEEWPGFADTKALQQYIYYCTNVEGFTPLIQQYLQRYFNRYMNTCPLKANLLQPVKNNLNVRRRLGLIVFYSHHIAGISSIAF